MVLFIPIRFFLPTVKSFWGKKEAYLVLPQMVEHFLPQVGWPLYSPRLVSFYTKRVKN